MEESPGEPGSLLPCHWGGTSATSPYLTFQGSAGRLRKSYFAIPTSHLLEATADFASSCASCGY